MPGLINNESCFRCSPAIVILLSLILLSLFKPSAALASPEQPYSNSEALDLTILHTNDEHGALIPHSPAVDFHPLRENPTLGGYARLATVVKSIRQEKKAIGEPVLLFSGGDFIGGTAYSWLGPLGYTPELSIKQIIGYDAVAIGNHEYDYGPEVLADYLKEAGYPEAHSNTAVLASNIAPPEGHPLIRDQLYLESHTITLNNGLKVGVFGLIGKDAVTVTTANEPVVFTDQHERARLKVDRLKQQGAELIIALSHSGVDEDLMFAAEIDGIDVIIGGHCHTALEEPLFKNQTVIVQAGAHLEYMGQLELSYQPSSGIVNVRNEQTNRPYLKRLDYKVPVDPEIEGHIEKYSALLNQYIASKTTGSIQNFLEPIAFSDFIIPDYPPLQETPLGNYVTDAMRLVVAEKTDHSPDFAIQANGLIRGSVNPGTMPHSFGVITFYDLVELVGLGKGPDGLAGYPLVAVYMTGDEIIKVLEAAALLEQVMDNTYFLQLSGLRYSYNPQNAVLFTIPFLDLPIPTTRAVIDVARYTGEGWQTEDDDRYIPLKAGDKELYCLVTDIYVASFLPMVGDMIPQLDLALKDQEGKPVAVDDLEELIITVNGEELKTWQAVIAYTAVQPVGDSGLPELDTYYASSAGRINPVWSFPLVVWFLSILTILIIAIYGLLLFLKKRFSKARRITAGRH